MGTERNEGTMIFIAVAIPMYSARIMRSSLNQSLLSNMLMPIIQTNLTIYQCLGKKSRSGWLFSVFTVNMTFVT